MPLTKQQITNFWDKVDKDCPPPAGNRKLGPCWEWLGSAGTRGYGVVSLNGKLRKVQRVAWEILIGPLDPTQKLWRRCGRINCVNPNHFELDGGAEATPCGVRNKLTSQQKEEIHEMVTIHGEKQADVARQFKISQGRVSAVVAEVNHLKQTITL